MNWPADDPLGEPGSCMLRDSQGEADVSTRVLEAPVANTPFLTAQTINPNIINTANVPFPGLPTQWNDDLTFLPDGLHNPSQYFVSLLDGFAYIGLPSATEDDQCDRASEGRVPLVDSNHPASPKHSPSDEITAQAPSKRRR
jgi:hypothetical protein